MSDRMIIMGARPLNPSASKIGMYVVVDRERTPDNERSPGLMKLEALTVAYEQGQPLGAGPSIMVYWQYTEGEDPYLVIEIDTVEATPPTEQTSEVVSLGYKVYLDDALIHAEGAP